MNEQFVTTDQLTIARQWPEDIDAWYRQLLLRQPIVAPDASESGWSSWLRAVKAHGMAPLLYYWLQATPADCRPPSSITTHLREQYVLSIASTNYREQELIKVAAILDRNGIQPVVLKGTAMAYAYYPQPEMRPSVDIDLLVSPGDYLVAREALLKAGYQLWRGDKVQQMEWHCHEQFVATRQNARPSFMIELHWDLSAQPQALHGIAIESLIASAKIISGPMGSMAIFRPVDAILHASFHLIYTHSDYLRLLWLYDIYLLAQRLDDNDWRDMLGLSVDWQARIAVKKSLELCAEWFGAEFPSEICDLTCFSPEEPEMNLYRLAVYRSSGNRATSWWQWHLFQLRSLNWRQRAQYIKFRLWPDRRELDAHYPQLKRWPYMAAYLARLFLIFRK